MSKEKLTTTGAVVVALGGTHAVAKLTGRKYTAAAHWSKFTAFPPNTFLLMKDALERAGYEAPASLWKMPEAQPEEMST